MLVSTQDTLSLVLHLYGLTKFSIFKCDTALSLDTGNDVLSLLTSQGVSSWDELLTSFIALAICIKHELGKTDDKAFVIY